MGSAPGKAPIQQIKDDKTQFQLDNSTRVRINDESCSHLRDRMNRSVSKRAFELYEQSGRNMGDDVRHWLQAESEVVHRVPEIRESASWYTVNVPVRGFQPETLYVGVDEQRAVIAAETQESMDMAGAQSTAPKEGSRESFFMLAEWPCEVDPSTASAYVKNDTLVLTAKRAYPG